MRFRVRAKVTVGYLTTSKDWSQATGVCLPITSESSATNAHLDYLNTHYFEEGHTLVAGWVRALGIQNRPRQIFIWSLQAKI